MKLSVIFVAAALSVPLSAQAESNVFLVTPGMNRNEVHAVIEGGTETSNGLKEVYEIGEEQAVLHYCGDTLVRVYVIEREGDYETING